MSNRGVAIFLAVFLGWCGIHKFYCHRVFQGVLYFFFCETGIPWLFSIIDAIRYAFMDDSEFTEKYS
jgi:TM2 domain-containing membrane protein YozV